MKKQGLSLTLQNRIHALLAVTDDDDAVFSYSDASESYYSGESSTRSQSLLSSDDNGDSVVCEEDLHDLEEPSAPRQTVNIIKVSLPSSKKECLPTELNITGTINHSEKNDYQTADKASNCNRYLLWTLIVLFFLVGGATFYFVFK